MPPSRRRDLVPRRRRQEDDGEEEGSVPGDFEEDSLSEGSAISNDDEDRDAVASDASGEQEHAVQKGADGTVTENSIQADQQQAGANTEANSKSPPAFSSTADTHAMLNGLNHPGEGELDEKVHIDDSARDDKPGPTTSDANIPKAPRNETPAQRNRREHQEYIRQRNVNPAFVPNRGGFFLHDDRSAGVQHHSTRPFGRGRGNPFEPPFQAGRGLPLSESTEKQWAHDLHDRHESVQMPTANSGVNSSVPGPQQPAEKQAAAAPNRTFSFSTVLGNVTVQVSLPGMAQKKVVASVVKNQHTLLPQHRPPLRRDKPVRISIPDQAPRYIFPSTERSFIFIPRALRPNQQAYARGRGRGSFHGSRRTSIFGGSAYTPSIGMSRRSSIGGVNRDGVRSPADSNMSRSIPAGTDHPRPIVRLPTTQPPMIVPIVTRPLDQAQLINGTVSYGIHSTAIPMHQPRPQKAVSVADIESPASFSFKPPQQQQEQPFHQQMPVHVGGGVGEDGQPRAPGQSSVSGGTPLSHIPESAIYANPFQPYPMMQQPMYYSGAYGGAGAFFSPGSDGISFNPTAPRMMMAPNFAPGSHTHPMPHQGVPNPSTMAHETNGMVYYYDPSQFSGEGQVAQSQFAMPAAGNMMGMAGMPQAPFYYPAVPTGMYYSTQSS